ncbi:unnamed protein product [Adineta steineri]|uniref:Uncharacterized protein n=1 Tax=Adineta steineri TaxID=433720 RepID=A0A815CJZ3_9BILA|nr:unnamed protein product [Adineta steineri]CAF1282182.1 unnamed protein product [Adineta steineri]CAF1564209.1 unnamed protein product [Adineta steineri]CAF1564963.1 unnamed protein product [Adineta steineri]
MVLRCYNNPDLRELLAPDRIDDNENQKKNNDTEPIKTPNGEQIPNGTSALQKDQSNRPIEPTLERKSSEARHTVVSPFVMSGNRSRQYIMARPLQVIPHDPF